MRQHAKDADDLARFLQHLGNLMDASLETLMERIRAVAAAVPPGSGDARVRPSAGAIERVRDLFHAATAPRLLSQQEASFHAWF